jgi:hypothetical protein
MVPHGYLMMQQTMLKLIQYIQPVQFPALQEQKFPIGMKLMDGATIQLKDT